MTKLNKFFFYVGLFTINAFRYNWKLMILLTFIVGTASSLLFRDPWQFIPAFIGSYLTLMIAEYFDYKNATNAKD